MCRLIETRGLTPQKPAPRYWSYPDGAQAGTLGGGCVEAEVRRESQRTFAAAPADLPTLDSSAIATLLEACDPQQRPILAATYGNRRSHPALFLWAAAEQVTQLSANETIRDLFTKKRWRGVAMPGVRPHDVDLPSDWEQNERKLEK